MDLDGVGLPCLAPAVQASSEHSYQLVVAKPTRAQLEALAAL